MQPQFPQGDALWQFDSVLRWGDGYVLNEKPKLRGSIECEEKRPIAQDLTSLSLNNSSLVHYDANHRGASSARRG